MSAADADGATPIAAAPANRIMILTTVMLATAMVSLDTTIANVALPHIAGSISASNSQIAWVLTSYMIATAIGIPVTGWLTARLGRKRLLLLSVGGFVATSALCGAAQSLPEIVVFRLLQGLFGAPLQPLAQTIILDTFTVKERGPALAFWGVGVMVAPIFGPVLGGWLTDAMSWRWVFYINLPIGALALLGVLTFIPETPRQRDVYFSWAGFGLLSVAIASAQIMFDRGESQGWFDSGEILFEGALMLVALWFFLVHSFTTKRPFLPLRMFTDVNFAAACLISVLIGLAIFSVTALLPTMLQTLYGLPVVTTGLVVAPRGIGSMISILIVGRLTARLDPRLLIAIGMSAFAASFFHMSLFTTDTSAEEIAWNGFLQGFGTGFVFLPMTVMAFATLAPDLRTDATGIFSLIRNFAASAGISIMVALVANFSARTRADMVAPYSLDNEPTTSLGLPGQYSITDPGGLAMLSAEIDRQAAMTAYAQVFFCMFLVVLLVLPLLLLVRPPANAVVGEREPLLVD